MVLAMNRIKVLLADDHTVVRQGIRSILNSESDIEVIAEAADGREALQTVEETSPDVAVMDISMPKLNGLEASRRILKSSPETKVILLSMYKEDEYAKEAVKTGVHGYILKDNAVEELTEAIRKVMNDEYCFAPAILKSIISSLREGLEEAQEESEEEKFEILTDREREILQLIAEGNTNEEIAQIISRSVETVRTHRANLMKKLEIHSVPDLVKFAVKKGIIMPQLKED